MREHFILKFRFNHQNVIEMELIEMELIEMELVPFPKIFNPKSFVVSEF